MDENDKELERQSTRDLLLEWMERYVGRQIILSAAIVFVVGSFALELTGTTLKGWDLLKLAFTPKSTMISNTEREIWDEWVILLEVTTSFEQAEAYRQQLDGLEFELGPMKPCRTETPAQHFKRNLRVVRHPEKQGQWMLVADVTTGKSSEVEVARRIGDYKAAPKTSADKDRIGPWLNNAEPYEYSMADFEARYGRIENPN